MVALWIVCVRVHLFLIYFFTVPYINIMYDQLVLYVIVEAFLFPFSLFSLPIDLIPLT